MFVGFQFLSSRYKSLSLLRRFFMILEHVGLGMMRVLLEESRLLSVGLCRKIMMRDLILKMQKKTLGRLNLYFRIILFFAYFCSSFFMLFVESL